MKYENIPPHKGTSLRRNNSQKISIGINKENLDDVFLINGNSFLTERISKSDLIIKPNSYYMVINNGKEELNIKYNKNISKHKVIYNPYKNEFSKKVNLEPDFLKKRYDIPEGYIDTLPKWYSFKFTYPKYNIIFIRPEYGISIQNHKQREEIWEIIDGDPIIISNNTVNYFVKSGTKFYNSINTYHSAINPNKEEDKFVIIKEKWKGKFDENDIRRVFNPNQYE